MPGLADFPEEIQPELVAVLTGVNDALQAIESTDVSGDPQALVSTAIERIREIEGRLRKPVDPKSSSSKTSGQNALGTQRLLRWAEDWAAVQTTLGAGDLLRARQLLKPYEL